VKKKALLAVLLVFVLALVLTAAVPAKTELARLEIKNRTAEKVMLSLSGEGYFFFLTVDPFTTKTFTVPRETFSQKTWSCGASVSGYLDMDSNVRLVFTGCGEEAPNKGEPTIEKVHIDDSPGETVMWRYFNWE
jgi:hypothetical protein